MEEKKAKIISISMPTDLYFISGIREMTASLLSNSTEFSNKWISRMQSVTDELCNNAIEYGSEPGGTITVEFRNHVDEKFEIIVIDSGKGKNPIKAADILSLIAERKAAFLTNPSMALRGRGLPQIVSNWTDDLDITDVDEGGLRVKITKNYTPDTKRSVDDSEVKGVIKITTSDQ